MTLIKWVLLESVWALGVLSLLALFGLMVYRAQTGNGRPVLVGLAVMVILFAVQAAVTTDRERVRQILDGVRRDVLNAETTNLRQSLSHDFSVAGLDANAFCDLVDGRFNVVRPIYVREIALEVNEAREGRLEARVTYWADVRLASEGVTQSTTSSWKLTFVETEAGWKIQYIEPDGPTFHGWGEVWGFR